MYFRVTPEVEVALWFPHAYTYVCTHIHVLQQSMHTNTPVVYMHTGTKHEIEAIYRFKANYAKLISP